jgi:hypothetical protein
MVHESLESAWILLLIFKYFYINSLTFRRSVLYFILLYLILTLYARGSLQDCACSCLSLYNDLSLPTLALLRMYVFLLFLPFLLSWYLTTLSC